MNLLLLNYLTCFVCQKSPVFVCSFKMDNWRRPKGDFYHHHHHHHQQQEVQGTQPRSHNRKPPHHPNWRPTVPLWEKKFCTTVGSVPWGKLLEAKRFMYLYENVVQWNDSAVEEAFHNAKTRFWAKINDLPCDISLPDPDVYIDEIDWNSDADPELLLDLEREPKATEEVDKDKKVVNLNSALLLNQSFSCTGWGDSEQNFKKGTDLCVAPNHGDSAQNASTGICENPWECNGNEERKDDGWVNCWNNSCEWNQQDNSYNEWENSYNESSNVNYGRGGDWEICDGYSRKRGGTGWNMSRYKTSRFQGDDYNRMDRRWKSRRGYKRSNFVCEKPLPGGKHSPSQWNSMNSCGPISHNGFGKAGISWGWEKQVL